MFIVKTCCSTGVMTAEYSLVNICSYFKMFRQVEVYINLTVTYAEMFIFSVVGFLFFQLSNLGEVHSIITQISMSLAIAERSLEFEHRDLHWGNVLIKPTNQMTISYILDDETKEVATNGLKVTIIDFTLSRLRKGKILHSRNLFPLT